jgi:hypothetical protein
MFRIIFDGLAQFVLKPRLIAILIGVIAIAISIPGYLFNGLISCRLFHFIQFPKPARLRKF